MASIDCRIAAVEFLQTIVRTGMILLDAGGDIQAEYRRHLNPKGQPGVGDQFYLTILNSAPHLVVRSELPRRADGEYAHLPQNLIDANFDPSDRKFAALAAKESVPVMNTTDSDWFHHRDLLQAAGIQIEFLCGCEPTAWFNPSNTTPVRSKVRGRKREAEAALGRRMQ